jgi:hypothetical protein
MVTVRRENRPCFLESKAEKRREEKRREEMRLKM